MGRLSFDSDEWITYALNLVDEYRRRGFRALDLEPRTRLLEDELLSDLSGTEIAGLVDRAGGRDLAESVAATRLLLRLVLSGDARIAVDRSAIGAVIRLLAADYPNTLTSGLALIAWLDLAPDEAIPFFWRHWSLREVWPLEAEVRFPIAGGGELALGPGRVSCRAGLLELPSNGYEDEHVWFIARIEIADDRGRVFRTHVPLSSHAFVEMLHHGTPTQPGNGTLLLKEVRCFSDRRRWLPVVSEVGAVAKGCAYWEKYLHLNVNLRRAVGGEPLLVVDVPPHEIGGVGGSAAPAAAVQGHLLARAALMPLGEVSSTHPPITFRLTSEGDRPQPGVRAEGSTTEPVAERFQWKALLEGVLEEHTTADFSSMAWLTAGWLAGIDRTAAEDRLTAIDPGGLRGYGAENLVYTLEHLARHFDSARPLDRLRELSRGSGGVANRAHVGLARLGHPDVVRIAQELEKCKRDPTGESIQWIGRMGSGIAIEGDSEEAVLARVREVLGSPSAESGTHLTFNATDNSGWALSVGALSMGGGVFKAHFSDRHDPGSRRANEQPSPQRRIGFEVRADLLLRSDDGQVLRIGRGRFEGAYDVLAKEPFEIGPDASTVELALELADDRGRVFRMVRPLTSRMLAHCWRADPGSVGQLDQLRQAYWYPAGDAMVEGMRIQWEQGVRLVVGAPKESSDEDVKGGLWGPDLLDLSGKTSNGALWTDPPVRALVVRVFLEEGPDRPVGIFACRPVATMVLMPALLGADADAAPPARIISTGRTGDPNPTVRVI